MVKQYKKSLQECEEYAKWIDGEMRLWRDDTTGWKTLLRLWKNQNDTRRKILVMYLTLWKEGIWESFHLHPWSDESKKVVILEKAYEESIEIEMVHNRALDLRNNFYKKV